MHICDLLLWLLRLIVCVCLSPVSHLPGQRQLRHPERQPADRITSGSGASTHPDSPG